MRGSRILNSVRDAGRDVLLAVIVTLALVIYIDNVREGTATQIRSELNALARSLCEEGAETDAVGHYNGLVDTLVADYQLRRRENIERRDFEKALINAGTIERLRLEKIIEVRADCSVPVLPER